MAVNGARVTARALEEYGVELLSALETVVVPAVLHRLENGATAPEPGELARRMLAVAPAVAPANKMAEQVGPEFYDTPGVMVVLAQAGTDPVSRQAVEHRRRRRTVLALLTADKRWIYPTWQFVDHEVLTGLPEVLASFGEQASWSVATWLTTARPELEGLTAVEWLHQGRDTDPLVQAARRAAARWAA